MTDTDVNPKTEPWKWPLEWWVDDKFWRDVASRAMAGLIVVAVTAAFALLSGLVTDPAHSEAVLKALLMLIVTSIWTPLSASILGRIAKRNNRARTIVASILSLLIFMTPMTLILGISIT